MTRFKSVYIGHFYVHCPHCGGSFWTDIDTPPQRSGGVGHFDTTCPHCKTVVSAQTA